jgi:hypothetical protein
VFTITYTQTHIHTQVHNHTHIHDTGQASILPAVDIVYTLSVTATNFLGGVSNTATLTIVKRNVPPPIISLVMPSGTIYNQDTIVIEGSASFSKCVLSKQTLAFDWAISTSATFATTMPGLSSPSAKFTIPAGALTPGTTYFVVSVSCSELFGCVFVCMYVRKNYSGEHALCGECFMFCIIRMCVSVCMYVCM